MYKLFGSFFVVFRLSRSLDLLRYDAVVIDPLYLTFFFLKFKNNNIIKGATIVF